MLFMAEKKKTPITQEKKMSSIERRNLAGLIYTIASAIIIIGGTYLAVRWANGDYRFQKLSQNQSSLARETGLLAANSYPTKASVYIDDKLVTATDDVIYLEPGDYNVKIIKDGYSPWEKNLHIEKTLVTSTDALLIPSTPSLTALSFTGAENLSVSPDGLKIIYYTASASAKSKNGLYLLDINSTGFITNPKLPTQITDDAPEYNLADSEIIWSSDSNQILLRTNGGTFLLSAYNFSPLASQPEVSFKEKLILADWEEDMANREKQFFAKYPTEILDLITYSAKNVYLSPDKQKMIYTATASTTLPDNILKSPVAAANSQTQERLLSPGGIYVYDLEEDRNFRLGTETETELKPTSSPDKSKKISSESPIIDLALNKHLIINNLEASTSREASASAIHNHLIVPDDIEATIDNFKVYHSSLYADTYQWLSDSKNLIRIENDQVKVVSYDGTNPVTIYAGQLEENFLYPWPDGSKLLILTSFNPETPANIYAIELKGKN